MQGVTAELAYIVVKYIMCLGLMRSMHVYVILFYLFIRLMNSDFEVHYFFGYSNIPKQPICAWTAVTWSVIHAQCIYTERNPSKAQDVLKITARLSSFIYCSHHCIPALKSEFNEVMDALEHH